MWVGKLRWTAIVAGEFSGFLQEDQTMYGKERVGQCPTLAAAHLPYDTSTILLSATSIL
jgi:hypothetical protein